MRISRLPVLSKEAFWIASTAGTYIPQNPSFPLTVLAALFSETVQAFCDHSDLSRYAGLVAGDNNLQDNFRQIVKGDRGNQETDGSFWRFNPRRAPTWSGSASVSDAVSIYLEVLLRTLRNGFSHFHWQYDDLSATNYWNAQHWSLVGAAPSFDLANRPENNFMAYIADAEGWDPSKFWQLRELRILVTPYVVLRYQLHLFLNQLLNGVRVDVFGRIVY